MDPTQKDENNLPLFPGLLPYGHTIGAPAFRPDEMGAVLSKSLSAMNEQIETQKAQILQQVELLKRQYTELEERRVISLIIYQSEMRFAPVIGQIYYLYARENETTFISLIEPDSWHRQRLKYIASVKLLSDMTWFVIEKTILFDDIYARK
jgi:hypothetical protein